MRQEVRNKKIKSTRAQNAGNSTEGEHTMAKRTNMMYPLGVTVTEHGTEMLINVDAEKLTLFLYKKGEKEPVEEIEFQPEKRIGDVWTMSLDGYDLKDLEYGFEADGQWFVEPQAKVIVGREIWGSGADGAEKKLRARVLDQTFNWDDDKKPEIPYSETIIYRLHVRGFTKHPSAQVRNKGTYAGVVEMLKHLKALGITTVELMPVTEFDEVMRDLVPSENPGGKPQWKANGKRNFWGYGPSYLYAPKASYGTGFMPVETEFKLMVKELHQAGMECIPEIYFTGDEPVSMVPDVLRFWVEEYHVDGFKLSGVVPTEAIAADPFLTNVKLFAESWNGAAGKKDASGPVSVREKNLAVYNGRFQSDMRKFLRGDQGMVPSVMEWTGKNPEEYAMINFMANTNGFTMMDMVSYNEKHNEANGEENRDGTFENDSWNCGAEGVTEVEKVKRLRKQQLYNAFLMLFLSQGTPLILAGDEIGNTQYGNNNAYCQDNEIGWVDWSQIMENADLLETVKEFISFRKDYKVFHMDHEAKRADHKSLGCPDVSYHGQSAWKADTEDYRKQLGIMYWGPYGKMKDGDPEETFYVAYNMHWGTHRLGLPRLAKGQKWDFLYDTSGGSALIKDKMHVQLPPYSVAVLFATVDAEYFTRNLQEDLVSQESQVTSEENVE